MGKRRDAEEALFDAFERELNEILKGTEKKFVLKKNARRNLRDSAKDTNRSIESILDELRPKMTEMVRVWGISSRAEIEHASLLSNDPLGLLSRKLKLNS